MPGLSFAQVGVHVVLADIDTLAARLKSRLPSDAAPMQLLILLNRYFFQ